MGEIFGVSVWWFISIVPFVIATVVLRLVVERRIINGAVVMTAYGLSGSRLAEAIVDEAGLEEVELEQSMGSFSDEYRIRTRSIRLSELAYNPNSVTAAAIAAVIGGYAVMHKQKNPLLWIRTVIVSMARMSARLLLAFILVGLILSYPPFVYIGVGFYVIATALDFITVFVPYMAAKRGLEVLSQTGFITDMELPAIKKTAMAAALINEAALTSSLTYFVRFIFNIGSNRATRG